MVTRETVADRLKDYVQGDLPLAELVAWAEAEMAEGEIDPTDAELVRDLIAQLGLADVAAFGLSWDDIRSMLERLGYRAHVAFEAAG